MNRRRLLIGAALTIAPVAQLAEAAASNPARWEFESPLEHQFLLNEYGELMRAIAHTYMDLPPDMDPEERAQTVIWLKDLAQETYEKAASLISSTTHH